MANIFNNLNDAAEAKRETLESKYNNSITNLLLVVAFSVINIVLLVANSNTYFLFSAFIPYFFTDYGMYFCGMYPKEYYYDAPDMEFSDKSVLVITLAMAAIIILIYLICWFFAKKKKAGWLIVALVLFVIDTVVMFVVGGANVDSIIDIAFHIWVIFSLVNGIVNYGKLKKLPKDVEESETAEDSEQDDLTQEQGTSRVLRVADTEVKARVLLETAVPGFNIVYRRVKRINELVVNGMVYDEYEALVEFPHTLIAIIDGHKIEVQYDAVGFMYIFLDGKQIAKKLRVF